MRSIFVLLILVMIGLNGKGQSVTALPDSVLSQCCLEVTLLNGNVTTVDWVFVQYITRDGTGTKLFVEYAPNFGSIQWETQIRIQDDFDDVLERSKFIVIPFTVGSTDYGINRNWIANIEENTTTGGTWIYGRFGTPTKRKFSAVEDYETMKNLLLACRPRAIVVAENGLYTEGDTVRMGGFLIENTTITTEGYNWMMKDTLSKTEFGIDYLTAETGDTTVYWGRRSGSVRQMMQMGNRYWDNIMKDTTGGLFSDFIHSWNSGSPFLKYLIFNPLDPNSGSVQFQVQKDNAFLIMSNETTNPYYTPGWTVTNNSIQIGVNESGSGDPGNGVLMGAFGDGTSNEYLFMVTKAVDDNTATNGQYLQLVDNTNGKVEFATINLSAYLPIADTAAMLLNYPSTAGYGIIDGGKTWRADTTSPNGLATRLFAKTLPTTIAANYAAVSNGTNLVARNLFDNNTYAGVIGRPWKFGESTTAGLPTGVDLYVLENSTTGFLTRYKSGSWENIITSTGASNGQLSIFSSAGKTYGTNNFIWDNTNQGLTVISTASANGRGIISRQTNVGIQAAAMQFEKIRATSAVQNGDIIGAFTFRGWSGTQYISDNALFGSLVTGTVTSTSVPTSIFFNAGATAVNYNTQVLFHHAGNVGIGNFGNIAGGAGAITAPARKLHVIGEARITDLITDTPAKIVGADSDGDLGEITVSTGLSLSGGVLSATGASTWLKTELEAGRDVDITGGTSTDLHLRSNTRVQVDGKFKVGQDSSFYHNPATNITGFKGVLVGDSATIFITGYGNGNPAIIQSAPNLKNGSTLKTFVTDSQFGGYTNTNGFAVGNSEENDKFGFQWSQVARYDSVNSESWVQDNIYGANFLRSSHYFRGGGSSIRGGEFNFLTRAEVGSTPSLRVYNAAVDYFSVTTAGQVRVNNRVSGANFSITDPIGDSTLIAGKVRFSKYGTSATTAAATSKTQSAYIAGFATDGTLLDYPISGLGNGIYTGSGTLTSYTTRARIPDNGNLYFGQRFNSNADSTYWYIANYGDGERELAYGITDTASTGFTGATFYSDGAGEMNWKLETSGASGTTSVKAQDGTFSVTTSGGNMSLSAGVANEVAVVGLIKAKQEAYYEITSTSSPQTFSNDYSDNFVNQGGTQSSFTFLFPASPEDGQILTITWNNAVSVVTLDGNGNTITGTAVTTATAGTRRMFKFYGASSAWVKIF